MLNKYHAKKDEEKADEEQEVSNIELLSEIRDILKRNEDNDPRRGNRKDPIVRFNRKVK
jgi:hypothetical protein